MIKVSCFSKRLISSLGFRETRRSWQSLIMENGVFDHVSSLLDHSYMVIDGSLIHSGVSDHGRCRQIFHTDPFDLTYKEEFIRNMAHNVNSSIASSSSFTSEEMRNSISNGGCIAPNICCRGVYDDFSVNQLPSTLCSSSVPPYYLVGSSEQGALSFDNELSLRLGSSHPSILNIDESYSDITQIISNGCGGSKDVNKMHIFTPDYNYLFENHRHKLPSCCGSSGVRLDLRYTHVVQEIFAELASYALENVEKMEDSLADAVSEARMSSSGCSIVKGFKEAGSNDLPFCSVENEYVEDMSCPPWEQKNSSMKSELINMLEMVDQRFNQFIDQIQNVVSAFHDKTKLGPNLPAQFALSTISSFYKNTRNRITDQIVSNNGLQPSSEFMQEEENFEPSFIQRQWALQQLKKRDQSSLRPQRGLPEQSTTVLRSWMFHNFLHPYPKDNEKQLLALRSGLTRNQVSNWFINARVRLWKPMIEEMYTEINKRNRAEGSCSQHRGHGDIYHQMS